MKNLFLISLLMFVLIITGLSQENFKTSNIPEVSIKNINGKAIKTSSFTNNGKPYLICFWASWCKPCIKELNAYSEIYSDMQEEGFKIIAIAMDDSRTISNVKPMVNGKGWEFEVYIDENQDLKRAMSVNYPPHTFIVNANNEIVWQHTAYTPGFESEVFQLLLDIKAGKQISESH